jgi:hypothetical protein
MKTCNVQKVDKLMETLRNEGTESVLATLKMLQAETLNLLPPFDCTQ